MNERQNLPSASSCERYALCPGSFALEQICPEPPRSDNAYSGDLIHAALATEALADELTDEQLGTLEACKIQEAALVDGVFGDMLKRACRERRLWALDESLGKLWSGKPDVVYTSNLRGLVIDYKTGRGEVTEAAGNMQLRALAVLAAEHHGLTDVTVAIIQPLAGPVSTCRYNIADLHRASEEIDAIMREARAGTGPRRPSYKACLYCRAKSICPEARAVAETLPAVAGPQPLAMTAEQIGDFLRKARVAERVIESVRDEAKRMLAAGVEIPGVKLKPGANRETITKPEVVFGRFLALGGTQEQFMPAVKVTKSDLKTAVKTVTNQKGKTLDATLERLLADCVETKQSAASLEIE